MKPIFSCAGVEIYNSDGLAMLQKIRPTVIITSPPYNAGKDYGDGGDSLELADYLDFLQIFIQTAFVSQPESGWLIINSPMWTGSRPKMFMPDKIIHYAAISGYDMKDWITWVKGVTLESPDTNSTAWGNFPTTPSIRSGVEPIIIFRKGWAEPTAKDITRDEWNKWTVGVWAIRPVTGSWHPAPFPYAIPYRLIKMYAAQGDIIADPFMGSGTVLKAARDLQRRCIGSDTNRMFCEHAACELGQTRINFDMGANSPQPINAAQQPSLMN